MDHHGSISHLFFFNKKHHRKASGFLQDSPGLGGEANPPWNRTPPTESLRSQKEEGHEKSGGSIEAAGGGGMFSRPGSWRSWTKIGEGVLEIVVLRFFTRDMIYYLDDDMIYGGTNHMENDAKEKFWTYGTLQQSCLGVSKSFLHYSYFPFVWAWFFVTTCFVFLTPKKHLALCELHSPQVIHFYVLNLSWYYRFFFHIPHVSCL